MWEVVRDVGRVGEWSHECTGIAWLGGATGAAPGARFRGRNRCSRSRVTQHFGLHDERAEQQLAQRKAALVDPRAFVTREERLSKE